MHKTTLKFIATSLITALASAVIHQKSQAQTVFRIVGPDGLVTFSDRLPAKAASVSERSVGLQGAAGNTLPFELKKIASQYPVTLYAGERCTPCGPARALLISRGIPFAEKQVNSAEDSQALQRLSGDTSLPLLTIGSQQLKGYSDSEWTQFLDAAGYPKLSQLPPGYRAEPATPLIATTPPATTPPARSGFKPVRPPTPQPDDQNPAGIRF